MSKTGVWRCIADGDQTFYAALAYELARGTPCREQPTRAQQPEEVRCDGAVGHKSVTAAVERSSRVVIPDFRRQFRDGLGGDIGRIGDDGIETAGDRPGPIPDREMRAPGERVAREGRDVPRKKKGA